MQRIQWMVRYGVILFAAILPLRASDLAFYWHSSLLFDRVMFQVQENPKLGAAAFHFLRVVGEGRADELSPDLLAAFSYRKDLFLPRQLSDPQMRGRAFQQIGRLATPEALAYLESIDLARFPAVEDQDIARSVPWGIFLARAARISDPQRRWEFYAETLRHPPEGLGRDGPLAMAFRGLCTEGALGFLPDVEANIGRVRARADWEEGIRSCKEMMHLVASQGSRTAGLEAALYVDTRVYGEYFRSRAIQALSDIHTQESRAILERFARAAEAKLGPSPETREAAIHQDPMLWSDFKAAENLSTALGIILAPPNGAGDRKE